MKTASIPAVRSIDHIHVYVADRAAAEHWYEQVMGFKRIKAFEFWAADGGPLTIENAEGTVHIALFERPPQKCRSTIALGVGAAEFIAWNAHLTQALGKPPVLEDHDLSVSLYFSDPDCNPYEITTYDYQAAKAGLAGGITGGQATADREVVHSRLIDAPRERVFRAFADPQHLARWWGPNGFSSTFEAFEFRPGGVWRLMMHGPDGKDYPNESVFREIAEPQRVVIEHLREFHHFILDVTLDAQGDQTLVGWRQVFDDAAHRDHIAPMVATANEQNLDRLAAEVRNIL